MATPKKQASNAAAAAGAATEGIKVIAKREKFYRGGQCFGHEPRVIALSDLTEEQLALIEGENMLITERVEIKAA